MQTVYIGNTLVNDIMLGSQRMDDVLTNIPYKQQMPKNGLLAWYDAGSNLSYNGSGTTWYDLSPNGFNLVAVSGSVFPTWDGVNREFDFNGSSNALIMPTRYNTGSLIVTTQVAWVKTAKLGAVANGGYAFMQDSAGNNKFDSLAYGNQGTGWTMASDNVERPLSSNVTESVEQFVMITGVRNTGTNGLKLYRNGANQIAQGSFSLETYTNVLFGVGANYLASVPSPVFNGFFSGSISMYAVYNRALSTDEINTIYNMGRV